MAFRLKETRYPVRIWSVDRKYGSDNPYTVSDLQRIVSNWNRFQKTGSPGWSNPQTVYIPKPDVSIGHDAEKYVVRAMLRRTDLPSAGEPKRIWAAGLDLFAELTNVPEPIADLCDSGQLKSISAEIYPDYVGPHGLRFGPALGRIVFLGSHPPRLKGMGPIPPFRYVEPSAHGRTAQNVVTVFAEVPIMNREDAIKIILAACPGWDVAPEVPDAWLIAMATKLTELVPPITPSPGTEGGGTGGAIPPMSPDQFAERAFSSLSKLVANQVAAAHAPVLSRLNDMQASFGGIIGDAERKECETFAEQNRDRLYPYELDAKGEHYIVPRLMKLPKDARDAEKKAIANRPLLTKFGERMPGTETDATGEHGKLVGGGGGEGKPTEARLAALRALSPIGQGMIRAKQRAELAKGR